MTWQSRLNRIHPARLASSFIPSTRGANGKRTDGGGGSIGELLHEASNLTGVQINERSALTLSAAYACQNVISTDLASIPLNLYKTRKNGGRDLVTEEPAAYLMRWSPDGDDTTSTAHRQAWIGHTQGWGNGFDEVIWEGGEPTRLRLLDPAKWTAKRREKDNRLYYLNKATNDTKPASTVMHLHGLGFDGMNGYSPVRLHKQGLAIGKAAESFGAAFFGNGTTVGGWIRHPRKLDPKAIENLRASIEAVHRGTQNSRRIGVLWDGMDFVKATVDPEDAQYLATRAFQVVEVCRIYRVPPNKLQDYSQAHYANAEAANIAYVVDTLRPLAVMLETIATMRLLTRKQRMEGFYFEHLMTALLRGDMAARATWYKTLRELSAITADEIRDLEGSNPLDGGMGKVPLAPVNMTPLKRLVDGPPVKAADAAGKPSEVGGERISKTVDISERFEPDGRIEIRGGGDASVIWQPSSCRR